MKINTKLIISILIIILLLNLADSKKNLRRRKDLADDILACIFGKPYLKSNLPDRKAYLAQFSPQKNPRHDRKLESQKSVAKKTKKG
jgi:hypothetical protein